MTHWTDVYPHDLHASVILKNNKIKLWEVGDGKLSDEYMIDDLFAREPDYSYQEKTWVVNDHDEHETVFAKDAPEWYRQWPHADEFEGFHAYEVQEGDNQ